MRTRSGHELDPLSPLPPSNVRGPPRGQRQCSVAAPPPPPPPPRPPLPAGVRPRAATAASTEPSVDVGVQVSQPSARGQAGRQQQQAVQQEDENLAGWVLRLHIRREDGRPLTKVGVQVTEGMNATALAACLGQACTSVGIGNINNTNTKPIAGLFVERNGLFVSLDHLLSTPSLRNNTFTLTYYPPPPQLPPPRPWYHDPWVWVLGSGPIVILFLHEILKWYGSSIWTTFTWLLSSIFNGVVRFPMEEFLREFYRYGPFIGWEGASLPAVCARITYYGDVTFWRRNFQECEDIYRTKEEAFLRVARPSVYAVLLVILLWLLTLLLKHFRQLALDRHHHTASMAPPPDMVDTYRAFQVLLRQFRKGLDEPRTAPPSGKGREDDGRNFR